MLLVGGTPPAAHGAPGPTPAEEVAPFVHELTRAVIHVDLRRVQTDPLMDFVVTIVPQAASYEMPLRTELEQARAALRAVGIEHFYLAITLADPDRAEGLKEIFTRNGGRPTGRID